MKRDRDYYDILEINRTADADAIKKAYRKLVKRYHPDMNSENPEAEKKFREITEAYEILSDPEKKKLYDRYGSEAFSGDDGAFWHNEDHSYTGRDGYYQEYHFTNENMEDFFGDVFGSMFGENGSFRRRTSSRGRDLHADVSISFDEAVFGCDKIIALQDPLGSAEEKQMLQVHVPAGIDSGKSIRLRGKGMPGTGGAEPGDLFLRVHVENKQGYDRKGMDIYSTIWIPYSTAVLGGEAKVATLYGNVICKINKGTQAGTKIRLKNKGIVSMFDPSIHGDHYVTVQIQVPKNISREAERMLKEYTKECMKKDSGRYVA